MFSIISVRGHGMPQIKASHTSILVLLKIVTSGSRDSDIVYSSTH